MKTLIQQCLDIGIDHRVIMLKYCYGKRRRKTILRARIKAAKILDKLINDHFNKPTYVPNSSTP